VLRFNGAVAEIVDVATGRSRAWYDGHEARVMSLAWSRDGRLLATRSLQGAVRVWSVPAQALLWTLEVASGRRASLAFGADGRHLYGLSPQWLETWDLTTGAAASEGPFRQNLYNGTLAEDGRRLAVCDGRGVNLLDLARPDGRAEVTHLDVAGVYHVAFDGPERVRCLCTRRDDDARPGRPVPPPWRFVVAWWVKARRTGEVALPADVEGVHAVEGVPGVLLAWRSGSLVRLDLELAYADGGVEVFAIERATARRPEAP